MKSKVYEIKKDGDATEAFTSEELSCSADFQWAVVTDTTGVDGAPTLTMEVELGGIWVPFSIITETIDLTKPKIYSAIQLPGEKVRFKYVVGGATVGTYSVYFELK